MTGYTYALAVVERARDSARAKLDRCPRWSLRERAELRRKLASIEQHRARLRVAVACDAASPHMLVEARRLLADQLDALPWWRLWTRVQLWRHLDLLDRAIAEVRS